jgi:hypothetical protein
VNKFLSAYLNFIIAFLVCYMRNYFNNPQNKMPIEKFVAYLKDLDDSLVTCIHKKFSNTHKFRQFFIFFEYLFHGVPWFAGVIITYLFGSTNYSSIAYILLLGELVLVQF